MLPGHLVLCGDIFGIITGEGVLLTLGRWRPGMLLNIPQCTGQLPTIKNYLDQNINSAEVEKPWHSIN